MRFFDEEHGVALLDHSDIAAVLLSHHRRVLKRRGKPEIAQINDAPPRVLGRQYGCRQAGVSDFNGDFIRPGFRSGVEPRQLRLSGPPGPSREHFPTPSATSSRKFLGVSGGLTGSQNHAVLSTGASGFGPPLETPTIAGRKRRPEMAKPGWTTSTTTPEGFEGSGTSNMA